MRITIKTLSPRKEMRYNTAGDWVRTKRGNLKITVVPQETAEGTFLLAVHEVIEAYLCHRDGITQKEVDDWDFQQDCVWGRVCKSREPGDSPHAPYYVQHRLATAIEDYARKIIKPTSSVARYLTTKKK